MKTLHQVSKLLFGSLFFLSLSAAVSAQTSEAGTVQAGTLDELVVTPMRLPALPEVNGSMFLSPDYKMGTVQLSEAKTVTPVPVKFNIFNNAIMVQKNGQEMKLEFFDIVSYDVTESNGSIKHFMFRNGYPEVDKNTDKTVYQVLSIGPKVHLLKFLSQKVEDVNTLGDYSRREIVTTEQLYLYVPGGEIRKIKAGKKDILAALPGLAGKIEEIVSANDLKLKTESDITLLVEQLNKP